MRVSRFIASAVAWLAAAAAQSVPRPALAVLLVALVLVPYVQPEHRQVRGTVLLLLAIPLAIAYSMPAGTAAMVLACPWLLGSLSLAVQGFVDGVQGMPEILRPAQATRLLRDAAPVMLTVGASFAVLDRGGVTLLGLSSATILVTAVHFHVLGFGLTSVLAALARRIRLACAAASPLLIGVVLTALGFTIASAMVQWIGAILVACAGLIAVVSMVRMAAQIQAWPRIALLSGAIVLAIGIPLGLAWATAAQFGLAFLGFDGMIAVHGTLNTAGTALGLLALRLPTP